MTLTDLLVNMVKAKPEKLRKMDIVAVAKKYHQTEDAIKHYRDTELQSRE